ncbi:MAG: acyltransferase family protein [Saprospiraceae bacterium]|nr:acyltransferase family protein [Saprospiraceae bacterium]
MGTSSTTEETTTVVSVAQVKSPNLKRPYANYIRAIAAFAVVLIHSSGELLNTLDTNLAFDSQWWTGNIYYSFLRWATPFFIMLSGSILLKTREGDSTFGFLRQRAVRVLLPFAFWVFVYILYEYRGGFPMLPEFLNKILFTDIYYHLWFIPMITGMYLLTPIFRTWLKSAQRSDVEYFVGLAFIITGLQHFWPSLIIVKYIGWLGYIGYYVMGYYLATYPIRYKKLLYGLGLVSILVNMFATAYVSLNAGVYVNTYFVYFSPNVVLMSAAWFLFLKETDWGTFSMRYPRLHQGIMRFSELSFGLYFIHVLVIDLLKNNYLGFLISPYKFFGMPVAPWIGSMLLALSVTVISYLVIELLLRVPFLKKVVM